MAKKVSKFFFIWRERVVREKIFVNGCGLRCGWDWEVIHINDIVYIKHTIIYGVLMIIEEHI